MGNGFQGLEGQLMPHMPDDFVELVSNRYIDLYERLTGNSFIPAPQDNIKDRIESNVLRYLADHEK